MNKIVTEFLFGELFNNWIMEEDLENLERIPFFNNSEDSLNSLGNMEMSFIDIAGSLKNILEWDDSDRLVFIDQSYADLMNAILSRYCYNKFSKIEKPYEPWNNSIPSLSAPEVGHQFKKDFAMLLNYMNATAPRYKKLLDLYASAQSKLMNKLSTEVYAGASVGGTSRFNDTPQDGGAYDDDTHTTNITETTSQTTSNSTTTYDDKNIMQRLDEIRKLYDNVLKSWCDEFEQFFWED